VLPIPLVWGFFLGKNLSLRNAQRKQSRGFKSELRNDLEIGLRLHASQECHAESKIFAVCSLAASTIEFVTANLSNKVKHRNIMQHA
jgi:hypothetical protein